MRLNGHQHAVNELNKPLNATTENHPARDAGKGHLKGEPDTFEKTGINKAFSKIASKQLKKIEKSEKERIEKGKISFTFLHERSEQKFIANPTYEAYLNLAQDFDETYNQGGEAKFFRLESILINPGNKEISTTLDALDLGGKMPKLDAWYEKNQLKFQKEEQETRVRAWKRDLKIAKRGKGVGGHLSDAVLKGKTASYYAKNRFTIRGNMFRINNQICGKSLEEMLPRYGSRRGKHIGIRVSQFTLNTLLIAAGYGAAPVSFGVSVLVSNQLQTIVTLTGEVIGLKFDGAKKHKMASHAAIRGVELELLRVPVVGSVLNYAENAVFGGAAAGIVATTLAEMILQQMSSRFTSSISIDDLGEPSVLFEMNQRIDYLSRFLLPYGQYLLLKESDPAKQTALKEILKRHFKTLKTLEHQNIKALNFYRLGLLAGRIHPTMREEIEQACTIAQNDLKTNTHRVAQKCLATLMSDRVMA